MERYRCYLNGDFYGEGSLEYMRELFVDYVVTCKMYGKESCEFRIENVWTYDPPLNRVANKLFTSERVKL